LYRYSIGIPTFFFIFSLVTQDDDTRTVMNAMADHTQCDSLKFYIVPASWFLKAWPLLTARSPDGVQEGWRESVGRIQNAELMNVEREVSSSDDEGDGSLNAAERQKKRFEQLHLRMATKRQQSNMKQGMVHKNDYFFLGPSSWMLVKEKFDFDGHELGRSCVSTGSSQNTLAIKLQPEESEDNKPLLIDIPASGRFAYEKVLPKEESSKSAVVPEEEDGVPPEQTEKIEVRTNPDFRQRYLHA
jgi:hypothetical protein